MDARIAKLEAVVPTLATKVDIGDIKSTIGDVLSTIGDMKSTIGDLKAEIGGLRASIAESKSDIIKWLSGAIFAAVAILLSAMFFLAGQLAPRIAQSPMQPQPIVIQLPSMAGAQPASLPQPSTPAVK